MPPSTDSCFIDSKLRAYVTKHLPSPTLFNKVAVVGWCYRKITPQTYTRSVGLAPPPGLGAHLIERHRYETSLLPLALRSSLRIHA